MPHLACRSCGRQVDTASPIESLVAEKRRCPRCGAYLHAERRDTERRDTDRRDAERRRTSAGLRRADSAGSTD